MILTSSVLGTPATTKLATIAHDAVLVIGKDKFTRADLAAAGNFNYVAARALSALFAVVVKPKDTRDVFDHVPPGALAQPGIGVFALAVLGAAFEVKHLGGDAPLEAWVKTHAPKVVTFDTFKNHARAADDAARQKKRRRKAR